MNRNLPGPDHWFSEDPTGLKVWSNSIKQAYLMLGNPSLRPTKKEESMRILARRSIVTLSDIQEGELFNLINIGLRRPGNGLPPKMLDTIIGKKSVRDILKGTLLQNGDFK